MTSSPDTADDDTASRSASARFPDRRPEPANIDCSSAPDWDMVPFEVGCARCGHDLRGMVEPKCPACNLGFDWSEAVPIEQLTCGNCGYHLYGLTDTRCPECGEAFTWEDRLRAYFTSRSPLVEYQIQRRPVRSFLRTSFAAFRSSRFWRSLSIHDTPAAGGLVLTILASLLLFLIEQPVFIGIALWLFFARWPLGSSPPKLLDLPSMVWDAVIEPDTYGIVPVVALWILFSFFALLVFQQSMRLFRVRTVHVLRVTTYAIAVKVPVLMAGFAVVIWLAAVSDRLGLPNWRWYALLELGWYGLWWSLWVYTALHPLWSIRQAYRYYLHMPHALGVAFASQIIAILATAAILVPLMFLK